MCVCVRSCINILRQNYVLFYRFSSAIKIRNQFSLAPVGRSIFPLFHELSAPFFQDSNHDREVSKWEEL